MGAKARSLRLLMIVVGLAVLAWLIIDFNSRMAELRRLSADKEQVSAQVTSLVGTQGSLQTQIAYATSENAVKEWAYQEGHWVQPGDNLVIPISPYESTPAPSPVPVVAPKVISNWQLWLALFVDRDLP